MVVSDVPGCSVAALVNLSALLLPRCYTASEFSAEDNI